MPFSTGLPGLDRVLRGVMPGDNVVWQVESIADYQPFIEPLCRFARENDRKVVYFRFADHPPLLTEQDGVDICELQPNAGFESFLAGVHRTIDAVGRGGVYVFDCLSSLAPDWCSDRMLGNFFTLSCPYLHDSEAVAYFAMLRNHHSFHAVRPISETTQILLEAYRHEGKLYVHPLKVEHRYSDTMFMLHVWEGNSFIPVTQSYIITRILSGVPWSRLDSASYMLGFWSQAFARAEQIQDDIDKGIEREEVAGCFSQLVRMLISHDEPVLRLAEKYFTLRDLLDVRHRMIGTGLIGGKSVGMLLARAILREDGPRWKNILEEHDSFFVGADVFYTYLVQNGCWWMVQERQAGTISAETAETARRRMLFGEFPEYILKQFADLLDYFGQSPIIVRSSSLLEDNFGNAFAGKYESVFCANQGGREKRLQDFLAAVRTVYASTMSDEALAYREQRGLLKNDEQMALLIQRVSGASHGNLFFPQAAGVGFSFNPYVWHESIDPEAGILRLVFGVGTRAVDRADDDYTRVVALNAPDRRPESGFDEVRDYAQRRVDVLDLETNEMISTGLEEILKKDPDLPLDMFASRDRRTERRMKQKGRSPGFPWVLTFNNLLSETSFVSDMREMLQTLKEAYAYPVDIEFTVNFFDGKSPRINLVQCRPLEIRGPDAIPAPPDNIDPDALILRSEGAVLGKSMAVTVNWIIYVVPKVYGMMAEQDRYDVARLVGQITQHPDLSRGAIMLVGPGRWGTTTSALGVPVSFSDIRNASVICELVSMNDNLIPDVSLGTHFFNELVENNMLYMAVFPGKEGHYINTAFLEDSTENRLADLVPAHARRGDVVRVLEAPDDGKGPLLLNANTLEHRVVCYRSAL